MRVVLGVITDKDQQILITRRSDHLSQGGYWEFPGGKLEIDEKPSLALIREIKDEVGLDVIKYAYLGEIKYNYNQKVISLLIYHVHQFQGQAVCQESQMDLRWVELNALSQYDFPPANVKIIELIRSKIYS